MTLSILILLPKLNTDNIDGKYYIYMTDFLALKNVIHFSFIIEITFL